MKTKLFLVLALILASTLSSCVVPTSGYGQRGMMGGGYGQQRRMPPPGYGRPQGHPGHQMHSGGGFQQQGRLIGSDLSGHMMQKRNADGTPDGAPFWAPAGTDLNAKFGKVNTKADVHVPGEDLQNFLSKYQ